MNPAPGKEEKNASREQILQASARLFARDGFNGTSFSAVASEANLSKTLVQYHFENKENLWRATVAWIWEARTRALPQYLDESFFQQLNVEEQSQMMRQLCRGVIRFTFDNPEWVRIMYQEAASPGPRLDWMIEHFLRPDFEQGRAMIELSQQRGLLPKVDPLNLLHIIGGSLIHITSVATITERILGVDPRSDAYIERYVDTFLEMMGALPHLSQE
jgi:AcrR family transcriptional regulator